MSAVVAGEYAPTAYLRWTWRDERPGPRRQVLQQWFAEDVPAYMRKTAAGEWRDVPVEQAVEQAVEQEAAP